QISQAAWSSVNYGSAITNSGGNLYATNFDAGQRIARLNPDGSFNSFLTGNNIGYGGIWTNPVTGHLLSIGGDTLYDTEPITGISVPIRSGLAGGDGVSVHRMEQRSMSPTIFTCLESRMEG